MFFSITLSINFCEWTLNSSHTCTSLIEYTINRTVQFNSIQFNANIFFLKIPISDHSVHAPSTTKDPWNVVFPENAGFHIKAVGGVFNLFRDAECNDNVNYPYLKLDAFVQDMNAICAMMADGPL